LPFLADFLPLRVDFLPFLEVFLADFLPFLEVFLDLRPVIFLTARLSCLTARLIARFANDLATFFKSLMFFLSPFEALVSLVMNLWNLRSFFAWDKTLWNFFKVWIKRLCLLARLVPFFFWVFLVAFLPPLR